MQEAEHNIEDVESYLAVGRAVILHVGSHPKRGPRVKCFVRGWQRNSYILLDRSLSEGADVVLVPKAICTLRFVVEGAACGCTSSIEHVSSGASLSLVRIQWPKTLSIVRVRKHERVSVQVPCTVVDEEGKSLSGELEDLSVGGCRLKLPTLLEKDERMFLSFTLPDGTSIKKIGALVRAAGAAPQGAWIGCEFVNLEDEARYELELFVNSSLGRLRSDPRSAPKLLIVDSDLKQATALKELLLGEGYEVQIAADVIDGFFWLRAGRPALLLASVHQKHFTIVDICRALRTTEQSKQVPILPYGEAEPATVKQLEDAGIAEYLPSSKAAHKVRTTIAALLAKP